MRRALIFLLLGPPLGLITGMWGILPLFNWTLGAGDETIIGPDQLVLLPAAYVMGFVPALIAAGVDAALAKHGVPWRPVWTGLAGFLVSFVPLLGAIVYGFLSSPWFLLWGLIGAAPALVCSLLSGEKA